MSLDDRSVVDRYWTQDREYVIRRATADDVEPVLGLYRAVLREAFPRDWFEWKYVENPYADAVEVYVAETDDRVVGATGFWLLPMYAGARTVRVVQPCDAAVHPAHRRRGVYSRILERGLERFADAGVEFVVDFPNEYTRRAFQQFGWRLVEERATCYRVQRPTALLGGRWDGRSLRALHDVGTRLARAFLAYRRWRGPATPTDFSVDRSDDVPAEVLASIYRHVVPDRFHAPRTAEFYRWRFRNPRWRYSGYVGRREGDPVAGIVLGIRDVDGARTGRIADVVPLATEPGRTRALIAVLDEALRDHRALDVVVGPGDALPGPVRRKYGFLSDRSFPLSRVTTPTAHGTYRLGGGSTADWRVDGRRIADPESWAVTFAEYDTG